MTITLTDLERRVIPNAVLLVGAVIGVAIAAATDPGSLAERGIAAAGAGGFLFCVALAYPRGMGMGDVKLVAVMGLYLGRRGRAGAADRLRRRSPRGLVLIAAGAQRRASRPIPFGPFLALGGVIGLWFGDAIVDWYLDSFFHD